MYPKSGVLPNPLQTKQELDDLDVLAGEGDVNETPFNVFIGHNLGHRVFAMSVPFRKFFEISAVANDRDAGPVAQRPLDQNHAKKLAVYMLKGLVSAAKLGVLFKAKRPSRRSTTSFERSVNSPTSLSSRLSAISATFPWEERASAASGASGSKRRTARPPRSGYSWLSAIRFGLLTDSTAGRPRK